MPPLVIVMPLLSSLLATSWEYGPPLPAQMTATYFGPFASLNAPRIFWMGAVKSVHRPIRYDGSNEMDYRASPTLGEHTGEVLAEVGVDAARLAVLKAEGIV